MYLCCVPQGLLDQERRTAESDSKTKAGKLVMLEAQLKGSQQREATLQQAADQLRQQLEAHAIEVTRLAGESGDAAELQAQLSRVQQAAGNLEVENDELAMAYQEEVEGLVAELQVRAGPGQQQQQGRGCVLLMHWRM